VEVGPYLLINEIAYCLLKGGELTAFGEFEFADPDEELKELATNEAIFVADVPLGHCVGCDEQKVTMGGLKGVVE
jgi:hypothetical protein